MTTALKREFEKQRHLSKRMITTCHSNKSIHTLTHIHTHTQTGKSRMMIIIVSGFPTRKWIVSIVYGTSPCSSCRPSGVFSGKKYSLRLASGDEDGWLWWWWPLLCTGNLSSSHNNCSSPIETISWSVHILTKKKSPNARTRRCIDVDNLTAL